MKPFSLMLYFLICFPALTAASIPDFVDTLYSEFQTEYTTFRDSEYSEFYKSFNLDPANQTNQQTYYRVYFLHDLITTTRASDGARSGFLGIPYFWHWVNPNPRHAIISLPDSTKLKDIKPDHPYRRYASRADIDRVPALFLGDLVSEHPQYSHPDCGSFFTFGWCSEREMAFTALMTAWGFDSKVFQSGIHTYSVVWCRFIASNGEPLNLAAEVDNTFDTLSWRAIPDTVKLESWREEIGAGTEVIWYNRMATSSLQIEALRETTVGPAAQNRIRRLLHLALPSQQPVAE